jgi:hypothetical protein
MVEFMKCIRPLVAAFTLTVAALTSGFVHAEPERNAKLYYVLGANQSQASVMSTNVEHNGDIAEAWVFVYLPFPVAAKDGTQFQAMWFLTDFNCTTNESSIRKLDVLGPDGKLLARSGGNGKFLPVQKGSMASVAIELACARDARAKLLTQEQVERGLARYSEAAQAAKADPKKSDGDNSGEN